MANVIGLRMVGGAYQRGVYQPGWNNVTLDNGQTLTITDTEQQANGGGMDGLLTIAEKRGHNATRYREKLDTWVKTGQMPQD